MEAAGFESVAAVVSAGILTPKLSTLNDGGYPLLAVGAAAEEEGVDRSNRGKRLGVGRVVGSVPFDLLGAFVDEPKIFHPQLLLARLVASCPSSSNDLPEPFDMVAVGKV